jgi:hypothetical protein
VLNRALLLISSIVLLQVVFVVPLVLAYHGYCFAQRRIVPAQEIQRAAIAHVLATYPPSIELSRREGAHGNDTVTRGRPAHPVRFAGVDDFIALHPHGCRIVPRGWEGYAPSALSRMAGVEFYIVRLHYPVRFHENGRLRSVMHERFVTVDRCAHVVTI